MEQAPENQPAEQQQLLVGRYALIRELGRGTQGRAILAKDLKTQTEVVLKELDFGRIEETKTIDLFEREARVLKAITHPKIPAYYAQFHLLEDDGSIRRYFLVQEYIEGDNLRDLIGAGRLFDEAQVIDFIGQILRILEHLHTQRPALIHRDIKPSNIICRTAPDGDSPDYLLIDFGAVQQQILAAHASSTVVGTSGYMPHEQLMGRAVPATDLYALGATSVFLLSRRSPSEMTDPSRGLNFRPFVNISAPLADFLTRLLAPYPEDRFNSASEALAQLGQISSGHPAPPPSAARSTPPPSSPEDKSRLAPKPGTPEYSRALRQLSSVIRSSPSANYTVRRRQKIFRRAPAPSIQHSKVISRPGYFKIQFSRRLYLLYLLGVSLLATALFSIGFLVVTALPFLISRALYQLHLENPGGWASLTFGAVSLVTAALVCLGIFFASRFVRIVLPIILAPRLKIKNGTLYYRSPARRERIKLDMRSIKHVALIEGDEIAIDAQTYFKRRMQVASTPARMMEIYAGEGPGESIAINTELSLEEQIFLMGELWAFIKREL